MTDNAIKEILNSDDLSKIEITIANQCGTYVNKNYIDFTIGVLRREIDNSGLTIEYIREQLILKKQSIIKLGVQILKTLKDKPIEEEYPEGEEPSEGEKTKIISSNGVGTGFGVKYAIYLDFLENKPRELITYLKTERIPNAVKFSKTLARIYSS